LKFHSGKFYPKNPKKYRGDVSTICYRSGWEAAVMVWLDKNSEIRSWASEEIVIPYVCPVDSKVHRYYVDFLIETSKGIFLVEVKPQKECLPPKASRRSKARVLAEAAVFAKNQAKWLAADEYASRMGYKFVVWDEVTLKKLGVVI
jgi:hypothetical protein